MRVDMDGNKQVGFGAVGDVGTLRQGNVDIGRACIDDLDVGIVVLYKFSEFFCYRQGQFLFLAVFAKGAGFVAAMTGVNNQSISNRFIYREVFFVFMVCVFCIIFAL